MANGCGLKVKKIYRDTYDFITEKWVLTHDEQSASRLQRFAHFWLLVFKSFSRNKGPLRATALAYTTLLGLIPLLAVGFGVASSFLKENRESTRKIMQQFVDAVVPQLQLLKTDTNKVEKAENSKSRSLEASAGAEAQTNLAVNAAATNSAFLGPQLPSAAQLRDESARDRVVTYITQFIWNAQSKTLGITGILGFVVVAVMLLSTIEDTFNDIWGVTRGRSWFRRFVQYWTTISLGPLTLALVVALVSSSVFQSSHHKIETLPFVGVFILKRILPFVLVSASFALFYKLMPNTQAHWRAASVAGDVGGSLWLLMNILSALQLSKVAQMSHIYGTLSLIPIFLIGLYFSWLILLFGAQVAYALQNRKMYLQERKAEGVNQRGREYVAVRVMTYLAQRFEHGARPPTILELATLLGVPSRLIGRVLQPLMQAGLVLEVGGGTEAAYSPARPLETINCHDILHSLRVVGGHEVVTRDEPTRIHVSAELDKI